MTQPIEDETEKKRGRPPLEINWDLAEQLSEIHCTQAEIAGILKISLETFKRRSKEPEIAARLTAARENGRASLRRVQWRLAQNHAGMAIWLGRQLLGQKDAGADEGEANAPLPWRD